MDTQEPYRKTVRVHVPDADTTIVIDTLHVLHSAFALQESLRRLWDYTFVGAVRTCFPRWYGWAMRSRPEPITKVARMVHVVIETASCSRWPSAFSAADCTSNSVCRDRYALDSLKSPQCLSTHVSHSR